MAKTSTATTRWQGGLKEGSGQTTLASGIVGPMKVDWTTRTAGGEGRTTPEELIAAAHSACFSMALAKNLADQGHPPESLETTAQATFTQTDAGFRITTISLDVVGTVPGMSADDFAAAARAAKDGCPVSNALSDDIVIEVSSSLA